MRLSGSLAALATMLSLACAGFGQTMTVSRSVRNDTSPALRDLVELTPALQAPFGTSPIPLGAIPVATPAVASPDTVLQSTIGANISAGTMQNFEGVPTDPLIGRAPPDTNGAAGLTQYVQTVNVRFAVFSKTGEILLGPSNINTLWTGFGGDCETHNSGDPIVNFDRIANRWVISQFAINRDTGPFSECVAVSTTSDATGTYNRYQFDYGNHFIDYPKIGVWPDGYYVSYNAFNATGTAFLGAKVCAFQRQTMLTNLPAAQVCFQLSPSFGGLLPSDMDGSTLPPTGAPNFFVSLGSNSLNLWKFHVDFGIPSNSTFIGPTSIAVAAFTPLCSGFVRLQCVPQPAPGTTLESLGDRLMHRLAYRNFGGYTALVTNHSISTGIRWYELRNPESTVSLFQSGTYAPDATTRWMGSIAMDRSGDMALGYSASSSSVFPSIRYTGRLAGDPLGVMQSEGTIFVGIGAQGPTLGRWGDYSAMQIDPTDDCTFWYTNEYLPANGQFNWRTRIASFKFPDCGSSGGPSLSASPASLSAGGTVTATWAGIPAPSSTDWIALYPAGGVSYIDWNYVSCSKTPGNPLASGSCPFVLPGNLAPGTYQLRLFANNTYTLLATSNNFTVTSGGGGGGTALTASPTSVSPGGTLTAAWMGIPGPSSTDWIALYQSGGVTYIDWNYVSCSKTPGNPLASGSCPFVLPGNLAPGTYHLRLFANNTYTLLATSNDFTVTSGGGGGGPTLTASPTSVSAGGTLTATWMGIPAPSSTDWIALYPAGGVSYIDWNYVSCSKTPGNPLASGSCAFVLPGNLASGTYQLRLFANNTYTLLATSNNFTVTSGGGGGGGPTLTVSPTSLSAGSTLTATWMGIPAPSSTDWIALFQSGGVSYIDWIHVSCSKTPGNPLASGSCPFVLPGNLAPGTYHLRLFANNTYTLLATSNNFTVTSGAGGPNGGKP